MPADPTRDAEETPSLPTVPPRQESATDPVPAYCLCRSADIADFCAALRSTCEDVPVMFFS